ncbi:MAG: DUF3047 domain-containing protein [Lentisphaeria bacterium]|nr:DUF3047 domain-containing protein [Lentisphaeria bacterium]
MKNRFRTIRTAAIAAAVLAPSLFLASGLGAKDKEPARHWDFSSAKLDKEGIPEGWSYRGKPGTPDVKYEIVEDKELKHKVLHITSDKASGVIMIDCSDVDLDKYPVMRWRWKAVTLPTGADATVKSKDDQGIAVYVGYGRLTQSSISYNWQTETPKGKSGHSTYNWVVDVDWFTLRDKNDKMDTWFEEEVNVRDDMKKIFKKIPSSWALSISSNSQYTESKADVYLDYVEFVEKKKADEAKDAKSGDKKDEKDGKK